MSDRRLPDPNDPAVAHVMRTEGVPLDVARQIVRVQGHADNVRDAAQAAVGARFGTLKIASSGHIVVKVVHPEPADQTALDRIAQDCGIPGWVRLESFPQEWVQAWDCPVRGGAGALAPG